MCLKKAKSLPHTEVISSNIVTWCGKKLNCCQGTSRTLPITYLSFDIVSSIVNASASLAHYLALLAKKMGVRADLMSPLAVTCHGTAGDDVGLTVKVT